MPRCSFRCLQESIGTSIFHRFVEGFWLPNCYVSSFDAPSFGCPGPASLLGLCIIGLHPPNAFEHLSIPDVPSKLRHAHGGQCIVFGVERANGSRADRGGFFDWESSKDAIWTMSFSRPIDFGVMQIYLILRSDAKTAGCGLFC